MSGATIETVQGSAEWKHGLFRCLQDKRLCILTYCVPCYVVGKNAEALGEECLLHGLLACIGLNFSPVIRWRTRQERNIKGSMLMDALTHGVLPCCALIQDARELNWTMPEEIRNVGRKKEEQTMERE